MTLQTEDELEDDDGDGPPPLQSSSGDEGESQGEDDSLMNDESSVGNIDDVSRPCRIRLPMEMQQQCFGRQSESITVLKPSQLESLVLAGSRMHSVVVKVVANGRETHAERLHGHTITFPHEPVLGQRDSVNQPLSPEIIQSAKYCIKYMVKPEYALKH